MRKEHRHPSEIPLFVVGLVIVALAIPAISLVGYAIVGVGFFGIALAALFSLWVARGFLHASQRSRSIKVGPEQFPEAWERILHYADRFGLDSVPDVYVVQEGGVLNAFAAKHNRRNFIQINSDIFEVGTTEIGPRPKDPKALDFVIAHEMGHVAASHVTYWYSWLSGFVWYVPFLGTALSRAKEYTADNWAHSVVPDGLQGIVMLSSGKYLYPTVNGQAIAERANEPDGFVWLLNAFATHPIQTKRLAALYDRAKPGKLF